MTTVTVKLFAAYQEAYGKPEVAIEVPSGSTVAVVASLIQAPYPLLQSLASVTRYGINLDFANPDTVVQEGDEIVLIPPVSGG